MTDNQQRKEEDIDTEKEDVEEEKSNKKWISKGYAGASKIRPKDNR